jgi:CheY-like chemotaxis protein
MVIWRPSHRIHVRPRGDEADIIVDVMAVPGERAGTLRGFTEEEWNAQLLASWSRGSDGRWNWRGGTAPFGRLATVEVEEVAPEEHGAMRPGRTFLLVDDEQRIAQALVRALRPYAPRWSVVVAASALEALRLLGHPDAHRIDAIVSDRRMPGMDGIQMLREAQRLHPRVVRVLLTGSGALREHAVAHRVLRKPCPPSVLIAVLDQTVDLARSS